jgi:hypothetical protein
MRRLIVASILLAPLAGCSLVDQTWFNKPAPTAPAVPALPPPKLESRAPLIVIAFATAEPDYGEKLGFAIAAAEASRRGIGYDVFGMAPVLGTPSVQAQSERDAASNAAKVMRAIMANGVPPARIRLGVRTETGLAAPEVRVFVR